MSKTRIPFGTERGEEDSPYAGCWVARLRGKIVAHGGTPEQARLAARINRYKENPEILYMPPVQPLVFGPLFESIRVILPDDLPVYLVGGAVRDALLQKPTHDLDFALPSGGIKIARRVADALRGSYYPLDEERDTGRVIILGQDGVRHVMDFASFRSPDPSTGFRQAQPISSGQSLETDLRGRDFTVNALAVDVQTLSTYDPLGGAADIRAKVIRACSPSVFRDDPVRTLRAVRQAASLGFSIETGTRKAMKRDAKLLSKISPERIRDELVKILEGPQPAAALRALDLIGALDIILPELSGLKGFEQPAPHVHELWEHTLHIVSHLENILAALSPHYDPETASDLVNGLLVMRLGRFRQKLDEHLDTYPVPERSLRKGLFLAALYHDIAKPSCKTVDENGRVRFIGHDEEGVEIAATRLQALQFSNAEIEQVKTIIRNHMRIHFHSRRLAEEGKELTRRGIYRFFRAAGKMGPELCLLALADLRATYEQTLPQNLWTASLDVCRTLLENFWEKPAESILPAPYLDGNDLIKELKLQPGFRVGYLLEKVREAQASGKLKSRAQALKYVREMKTQMDQAEIMEYIQVDSVRIAFFQRPGQGIPVVLLHGFPFDHTIWQPVIPFLPPDAWLILPDLRGHGQSDAPPGPYSMAMLASDIAAILGYLRVRKAVLVGHSMGGYVALAYARTYPKYLAGLGLVASRADADTPEGRAARYKLVDDIPEKGLSVLVDAMLPKLTPDEALAAKLRDVILGAKTDGVLGVLQGMAERPDSSSLLASLNVPLMAVVGGRDMLIAPEQAKRLASLTDRLRLVEIPEAGHMPMMESPEMTAKAILQLMDEVK